MRRPGSDGIGRWNFERIAEVTVVEQAEAQRQGSKSEAMSTRQSGREVEQ